MFKSLKLLHHFLFFLLEQKETKPPILTRGFISLFFVFFFNNCEAQNVRAVSMNSSESHQLSGIYSSKNSTLPTPNTQVSEGVRSPSDPSDLPSDFPINDQHYKEEIEKRTLTSRTFNDGRGGVVINYGSKNLNYLDKENKLQPIDLKLNSFSNAWSAQSQQYPTYLNKDGSTALTSDEKNKIIFNKNCKINNTEINYSDYTVGEEGMLINNVIEGIDKKIIFNENRIETDYVIRQPMNTGNQDIIFSEEIELPEGYYLSLNLSPQEKSDFVVYSPENKEQARFRTPVFYDAKKIVEFGKYNLLKENGKTILQITIPGTWLNDPNRSYPITIDPLVTGPIATYPAPFINSCRLPNYAYDSILVTIPPNITIVNFFVRACYWADAPMGAKMKHGFMSISTPCNTNVYSCQVTSASDSSGMCYLVGNTLPQVPPADLRASLACCFAPSCSPQTFYLRYGLARNNYGPGCNRIYIYYSSFSAATYDSEFSAYIVGRTVETAQVEWSVTPLTVCSDSCTLFLDITTNYGVPPYTITHPWATGAAQYGVAVGSCNSTGSKTITLTIPNCPAANCGTVTTLIVSPPLIVAVCGDTVLGLSAKTISVNPVPEATASTTSVCSGQPLNIPVTSCITGTTFQWMGSDGSSGTGNISDTVINTGANPIVFVYSVVPTASGCVGPLMKDSALINPLPVINGGVGDTIEAGGNVQLNATGGLTYLWSPTAGLSCANCPNPLAAPVITTLYTVTGTNENGCSSSDSVTVFVTQGSEVLYIPNSFTPNDNNRNDLFFVYGTSIKTIDIKIYNRWGELVFRSTDVQQGWDGKLKGKYVEGGVYVYTVNCEWFSGTTTTRRGIVTVWR